jgi:hypothetical protein
LFELLEALDAAGTLLSIAIYPDGVVVDVVGGETHLLVGDFVEVTLGTTHDGTEGPAHAKSIQAGPTKSVGGYQARTRGLIPNKIIPRNTDIGPNIG